MGFLEVFERCKLKVELKEATDWIFEHFSTVDCDDKKHDLYFADPGKSMRFLSHRCNSWAQICRFFFFFSSLDIVLFEDEITGGTVVAPDPPRKVSVCYITFLLLKEHICCGKMWLPIFCRRHKLSVSHVGGSSGVMAKIIERLLSSPWVL